MLSLIGTLILFNTILTAIKSKTESSIIFFVGKEKTNSTCILENSASGFPLCDGSLDKPFPSILKAIYEIELNHQEADIAVIYILDKAVILNSYEAVKFYPGKDKEMFFSTRDNIKSMPKAIHILPASCINDLNFTCAKGREKVTIYLKGKAFLYSFLAYNLLHIENFVFNGIDMNVDEDYLYDFQDPTCYEKADNCCTPEMLDNEELYVYQCYILKAQTTRGNPMNSGSLFYIGYDVNSSLIIINCDFEFFNEMRTENRYGMLIDTYVRYEFNVVIERTTFKRCYFEKGLLVIMGKTIPVKKKLMPIIDYTPSNMTLKDIMIIGYNFYDFRENSLNNAYILTFKDIGNVETKNIIFKDASRLVRIESNNGFLMALNNFFIGNLQKVITHQIFSIEKGVQIFFNKLYFEDIREEKVVKGEEVFTDEEPVECLFRLLNRNSVTIQNGYFGDVISTIGLFDLFSLNNIAFLNCVLNNISSIKKPLLGGYQSNNFSINSSYFINLFSPESTSCLNLYFQNNLIIFDSKFFGIRSDSLRGNMLINSQNKMVIENCFFSGFKALESGSIFIINKNNMVIVKNSTFAHSETSVMGGGIFFTYNNSFILSNSTFQNLSSNGVGGALLGEERNLFMINSCRFYNDSSLSWGGGILLFLKNILELNSSVFENNHGENGAAIYLKIDNKLKITNTSFKGNMARLSGGALYFWQSNDIFLSNCTLEANMALSGEGGSISFGENQTATMEYVKLNDSSSDLEAGGIYLKDFNTLSLYYFEASQVTALSGGFMYASSMNKILLKNSKIYDLMSLKNGGCFYSRKKNDIMIINSLILNVTTKLSGAIIYSDEQNMIVFLKCSLINITSKYSGGALYMGDYNQISIIECFLRNITSLLNGGTFYVGFSNSIYISKMNLTGCTSLWEGGFLFAGDMNLINISNSVFRLVGSADEGGIFYILHMNSLIISNSNFSHTYAMAAAVIFASVKNEMDFRNCIAYSFYTFSEGRFGVLYNNNSLKLSNTTFNLSKAISEEILFMRGDVKNLNQDNTDFLTNHPSMKSELMFEKDLSSNSVILVRSSNISINSIDFRNIIDATIIRLRNAALNQSSGLYIRDCNIFDKFMFDSKKSFMNLSNLFLKGNEGQLFTLISTNMTLCTYRIFANGTNLVDTIFSMLSLKDGRMATSYRNEKYTGKITQTFFQLKDSVLDLKNTIFRGYKSLPNLIITIINMTNSDIFAYNVVFKELHSPGGSGAILARYIGDFLFISVGAPVFPKWVIYLEKCLFLLNGGFTGGAISVVRKLGTNNNFIKFFSIKKTNITIKESNFVANSAQFGGAIYLENGDQILISRSSFVSNVCWQYVKILGPSKGGALYSMAKKSNMNILNSVFAHNKADLGGGIFWKGGFTLSEKVLISKKNSFVNNTAVLYGRHFSSSTQKMKFNYTEPFILDINSKNNRYILNNLLTGFNYTECLVYLIPFDTFGQVTYCDPEEYPQLIENFSRLHLNELSNDMFCIKGVFDRTRHIINDSIINFKEIPIKLNITEYNQTYQLTVVQHFRECKLGERLTDDLRCMTCLPNTYSFERTFNNTSDQCRSCYGQPFNCYGGSDITPKPGYWRVSVESNIFLKCPLEASCIGDDGKGVYEPAMASGVCHKGFKGILCSQCEEGYGLTNDMKCGKCDDFNQIFLFILGMVLKLSFIIYTIHKSLVMCMTISSDNVDINEVISSNLLKILTNHLQCLLIIFSLPIDWPMQFWREISVISSPSITSGSSLHCFLEKLGMKPSYQYTKVVMMWIHPFILVLICIIYVKLYKKITGGKSLKNVPQSFLSLFQPLLCIVLLISYADFVSISLELFKCIDIGYEGHPEIRLAKDYSILCWTDSHIFWITKVMLPFIIFFGLGVPLFIIIKLASKSGTHRLHEPKILFKYGYFYYACESKYFYWDFIILLRKILLTFFGIYFIRTDIQTDQNLYAVLLFLAVVLLALYLHVLNTPYRKNKIDIINDIEKKSLISLSGSIYFGLMSLNKNSQFFQNETIFYMFMIYVTNFLFFLPWVRAFINYNAIYIYYDLKQITRSVLNRIKGYLSTRHDSKEKLLSDSSNFTDTSFSIKMSESMQIREEEANWIDDRDDLKFKDRPRRARTFSTKRTIIRGRNRVTHKIGPKNNKPNQNYKKKYHDMKKKFKELEVVTKIVTLENQKIKKKLIKSYIDIPGTEKKTRPSAFLDSTGKEVVTPQIRDNIIYGNHTGIIKKQLIEMKKINLENRLRLKLCSLMKSEAVLYRDQRIEIRSSSSSDFSNINEDSKFPSLNLILVVRNVSATKVFSDLRLTFGENKRIKYKHSSLGDNPKKIYPYDILQILVKISYIELPFLLLTAKIFYKEDENLEGENSAEFSMPHTFNKFIKFLPAKLSELQELLDSSTLYKESINIKVDELLILGDDLLSVVNNYFEESLILLNEKNSSYSSNEIEPVDMGSLISLENFPLLMLVSINKNNMKLTFLKPILLNDLTIREEERLEMLAQICLKTYETLFAND